MSSLTGPVAHRRDKAKSMNRSESATKRERYFSREKKFLSKFSKDKIDVRDVSKDFELKNAVKYPTSRPKIALLVYYFLLGLDATSRNNKAISEINVR